MLLIAAHSIALAGEQHEQYDSVHRRRSHQRMYGKPWWCSAAAVSRSWPSPQAAHYNYRTHRGNARPWALAVLQGLDSTISTAAATRSDSKIAASRRTPASCRALEDPADDAALPFLSKLRQISRSRAACRALRTASHIRKRSEKPQRLLEREGFARVIKASGIE